MAKFFVEIAIVLMLLFCGSLEGRSVKEDEQNNRNQLQELLNREDLAEVQDLEESVEQDVEQDRVKRSYPNFGSYDPLPFTVYPGDAFDPDWPQDWANNWAQKKAELSPEQEWEQAVGQAVLDSMTRFWKYACNCNATDEEAEEVAWYIVDTRADEWRAARDVTFFAPPPRTHFRVQDPTELPNVTEVAPVDSPVSLPELWVTKEFYRAKLNGSGPFANYTTSELPADNNSWYGDALDQYLIDVWTVDNTTHVEPDEAGVEDEADVEPDQEADVELDQEADVEPDEAKTREEILKERKLMYFKWNGEDCRDFWAFCKNWYEKKWDEWKEWEAKKPSRKGLARVSRSLLVPTAEDIRVVWKKLLLSENKTD